MHSRLLVQVPGTHLFNSFIFVIILFSFTLANNFPGSLAIIYLCFLCLLTYYNEIPSPIFMIFSTHTLSLKPLYGPGRCFTKILLE